MNISRFCNLGSLGDRFALFSVRSVVFSDCRLRDLEITAVYETFSALLLLTTMLLVNVGEFSDNIRFSAGFLAGQQPCFLFKL